jgi:hypothetical protein
VDRARGTEYKIIIIKNSAKQNITDLKKACVGGAANAIQMSSLRISNFLLEVFEFLK